MTQFLNQVSDHVADMTAAVKNELRGMQRGRLGTEPRSPQQKAALWRKMKLLPPEQFQQLGMAMASRSGHDDAEEQPCQFCDFLFEHAGR